MAFASDAIGFYLQAEDQLTPALSDAAASYRKFVREMEKSNKAAFKAATTGLGSLANIVEAFEDLPKRAVSSYKEALSQLRSRIKPVTQPINVVFSAKSRREIAQAVAQAISRALTNTKLRLSASFPKTALGLFDTTNLRSKYGNMAQPPDFKGKLEPKRFKKGGLVEGGTPGKDSVLSLLEPGEFVLPKDLVKEIGGQMRGKGGQFISAKTYAESIARIDNLGKALGKLKTAIDAGFKDPKALQMFERGMTDLNNEIETLVQNSSNLTYQQQVRLAPAIKETRAQMEALRGTADKAGKVTNNLLEKILGPARFLAISAAAQHVVDGLSKLKDGGMDAFGALGGDQIESFTTNMNQMNSRLNLSRDALRAFKGAAADVADLKGLNINEMSEAMEGMVEAGLRDEDMLLKLAPAASSFAKASRVSFDTAGLAAYKLSDAYGFTEQQIAGTFDNIAMFQANSAANAEQLTTDLLETTQALGPALLKESTADQQAILSNFARLGASLADNWAGSTGQLQGLLGRAMGGEVEAMKSVGLIFGKSQQELTAAFKSGDLTGLLDGLAGQIQHLTATGNVAGLEKLRESLGFEGTAGEFGMLGANIGKVNNKLDQLGAMQHTVDNMGEAQTNLTKIADSNRTAYEQLQTTFGQFSAKEIPFLEVSYGQLIDLGKEFNVTTLLSLGYLAKLGAEAVATGAKGLIAGVKWVKGWKMFGGAGKAASAAKDVAASTAASTVSGGSFASVSKGAASARDFVTGVAKTIGDVVKTLSQTVSQVIGEILTTVGKGVATLAESVGGALSALGKGIGGAISGLLSGLSTGLAALAVGVGTLGAVLLSPPGIAFTVSLVAALLALGAALNLASPAIQVFGDVAIAAIGKAVEGFGMLVPVLLKIVEVAGTVLLGAINGIVAVFQTLFSADVTSLLTIGPALFSIAGGMAAMAVSGTALAAAQAGRGFLSFITGGLVDAELAPTPQATNLQQSRTTSAIAPSQIQAVVDAIVQSPAMDQMAAAAEKTNVLLARILETLASGQTRNAATASPSRVQGGPALPSASALTRDVAAFGH